ncbi:hypothetical protein P9112_000940 [Eukaryota sp. TZLM1-RC]
MSTVLACLWTGHRDRIDITDTPFLVGRCERSHLVISSRSVSFSHARIDINPQKRVATITDLNTKNGTFVNDQRLLNSKANLPNDAHLKFGYDNSSYKFQFVQNCPSPSTTDLALKAQSLLTEWSQSNLSGTTEMHEKAVSCGEIQNSSTLSIQTELSLTDFTLPSNPTPNNNVDLTIYLYSLLEEKDRVISQLRASLVQSITGDGGQKEAAMTLIQQVERMEKRYNDLVKEIKIKDGYLEEYAELVRKIGLN